MNQNSLKPFGFAVIDKPVGITSNAVLSQVRRIVSTKRAGHTGTLDPFASGVLVVGFGAATRLFPLITSKVKRYTAVIHLGVRTDTADVTGDVTGNHSVPNLSAIDLDVISHSFIGKQAQTPPAYSAKKVGGVPSYVLARNNQAKALKPVDIEIYELKITDIPGTQNLEIDVLCSRGTYIRTLGESIAERLGTLGYCQSLRRELSDGFTMDDAVPLDEFVPTSTVDPQRIFDRFAAGFIEIDICTQAKYGHQIDLKALFMTDLRSIGEGDVIAVFCDPDHHDGNKQMLSYCHLVGMYKVKEMRWLTPLMVFA